MNDEYLATPLDKRTIYGVPLRTILIDAIFGAGVPMRFVNSLSVRFTGNQWNESWAWQRDRLEKLSTDNLAHLYSEIKREFAS